MVMPEHISFAVVCALSAECLTRNTVQQSRLFYPPDPAVSPLVRQSCHPPTSSRWSTVCRPCKTAAGRLGIQMLKELLASCGPQCAPFNRQKHILAIIPAYVAHGMQDRHNAYITVPADVQEHRHSRAQTQRRRTHIDSRAVCSHMVCKPF